MTVNKLTLFFASLLAVCCSCGKGTLLSAPSWTKNPKPVEEGLKSE